MKSLTCGTVNLLLLLVTTHAAHPLQQWARGSVQPYSLFDVVSSTGYFIAVGERGIVFWGSTPEPREWIATHSGTYQDLCSIAVSNQTVYAVGRSGTIVQGASRSLETIKPITSANLHDISASTNEVIAVGNTGTIIVKTGNGWMQAADAVRANLHSVTHGKGMAVAVGSEGTILRSVNGLNWEQVHSQPGLTFTGVTFGHGVFVAVGTEAPNFFISADGQTWNPVLETPRGAFTEIKFQNN